MIEAVAQYTVTLSLQARFLQGKIAKEKTHINKHMRSELLIIKTVLSQPLKYNLETPIAHIVPRDPDFITYGDACLETAGGFSEELKFWRHVEFPDSIKSKTQKDMTITRKCALSQELVSINLLEFLTEIFNYAAVTMLHHSDSSICLHRFPFLLNLTDNQVSKAWIKRQQPRSPKRKRCSEYYASLCSTTPLASRQTILQDC